MIENLQFYKGNRFTCFMCDYNDRVRLFGNNESGKFTVGNFKDINQISRVSIELEINRRWTEGY